MRAISRTSESVATRSITGTSVRPARPAARHRRSPAINSKKSPLTRTTSGWMMPCSRIESASSASDSGGNSLRGCRADGRTRSRETLRTTEPGGGGGATGVAGEGATPGGTTRPAAAGTGGFSGAEGAAGAANGDLIPPPISAPNPRPKACFDMARTLGTDRSGWQKGFRADPRKSQGPSRRCHGRMAWKIVRAMRVAPAAFGWILSGNISG